MEGVGVDTRGGDGAGGTEGAAAGADVDGLISEASTDIDLACLELSARPVRLTIIIIIIILLL